MAIPLNGPLSTPVFRSPAERRSAWRQLMWGDHGWLRKFYDNSHEVSPGKLWRSYQPSPAGIEAWRARGVRTIVNLRGPKPSGYLKLEQEACEKAGIELVIFRAWSREAPSPEFLREARALFERIEYPALIHCKSGADRAGLVAALFRFFHEGAPLPQALEQLSWRYGHVRQGKTGVIDAAFEQYLQHTNENDISLRDVDAFFEWVDTIYDSKATKAAFNATPWGRLLSDTILKRE